MLTATNLMVPKQVPTDQSHEAGGGGKALLCGAQGERFPSLSAAAHEQCVLKGQGTYRWSW